MYEIRINNCFLCEQNHATDIDIIKKEHPEWFPITGNSKYREQFVKRIKEIRAERQQQCVVFGDGDQVSFCKKHLQEIIDEMGE